MRVGSIKTCFHCDRTNYIKEGTPNCPYCGEEYGTFKPNQSPQGWVKLEDHEISRRSVETMLRNGDITLEDLRR